MDARRESSRSWTTCGDNLRTHRAKAVKKWLDENAGKVAAFHLPRYSSELNPDELLNASLKQRVTKATWVRNTIALTRTAAWQYFRAGPI